MYEAVSFSLTFLTLFNLLTIGSFTVGSARLCPNGSLKNNTSICLTEGYQWDTISEMITRDDRVRNGFAAWLFLSAFILFCTVSLILERLDFYYHELSMIGSAARQSNSYKEFVEQIMAQKSVSGKALLNSLTKETYDAQAIALSSDISTPHSTYAVWSPLAFYKKKKKLIWLVYCAGMIFYVGIGVYSTDINTRTHTDLAKCAFTLLMILALLLTHLSWNNMAEYHTGQILTSVSVITSIASGLAYSLSEVYWWEFILVISLHTCLLGISKFRILFAFKNVSVRRYGGGDYRVDLRGPHVEYLNLRL